MRVRAIGRTGLQELRKGSRLVVEFSSSLRDEVVSTQEVPNLSQAGVLRSRCVQVDDCNYEGLFRWNNSSVCEREQGRSDRDCRFFE